MDKEFKTTFIPKKNLAKENKAPDSKQARARRSLFGMIALLLFVTALVSTVGVYLYKIRLAATLNSRIESINRAEKAFEPSVILDLKKLDIRLQAGTQLLKNHVAISDFLASLAESTLPDVSYSGLSFAFSPDGSTIAINGEARGYLQIAQQSDIFETNQYIQNHIFSDFSLTDTGRITFSLNFTINPELMVFGRNIKNNQVDAVTPDGVIIENQNDSQIPQGVDVSFDGIINSDSSQN